MSSSAATATAAAAAEKETRHYTRRTTRQRVVDLLREAIELVEKRCAEPAKGATLMPASASVATAAAAEPLLLSAAAVQNSKKPKTPKATATLAAMNGSSSSSNSQTLKVKKMASCPGGPKAFNEFLKKERSRVEAELGPSASYANVRRKIAANWKAQCGASNSKTRKTAKATATTPGRVNAKVPLMSAIPEGAEEENSSNTTPRNNANRNSNANRNANRNANANKGYENLGMDDTLGMRKIRIGNRDLFMTEANSGLFEREDDMNPGGFVGYLKNGRIVESNSPENENSLM